LNQYIKITSQDENAFEGSGGQGDTVYYVGLDTVDIKDSFTDADGDTPYDAGEETGWFDLDGDGGGSPETNGDDTGYIVDDSGKVYKVTDGLLDSSLDGETIEINGKTYHIGNSGHIYEDGGDDDGVSCELTNSDLSSTRAVYLIKDTPSSNKYKVSDPFDSSSSDEKRSVKYEDAGSSRTTADGGVIVFTPGAQPEFDLVEDAGNYRDDAGNSDSHIVDWLSFVYDGGFKSQAGGYDDKVIYKDGEEFAAPARNIPNYPNDGDEVEEGKFISPRGTLFESMDSDTVLFKVAKKIGEAQYEFATSEAAEEGASTQTLVLHEGESGQVGDVTIDVESIDEDVGACSVSAGGTATCTVPASDVQAVIMPQNSPSVQAITPYQGDVSGMVVLDSEAGALSSGVIISVGGPAVNSVSQDILAGTGIDLATTPVVVEAVGDNKIIVAGYTAQDTMQAGQQFLSQLQRQ
jgi:hypothetical protein